MLHVFSLVVTAVCLLGTVYEAWHTCVACLHARIVERLKVSQENDRFSRLLVHAGFWLSLATLWPVYWMIRGPYKTCEHGKSCPDILCKVTGTSGT